MNFTDAKLEQDLVLYAKWEAPTYTVTYDLNGGTWTETGSDYVQNGDNYEITVDEGNSILEPQDPTKTGFNFNGWYYETIIEGKTAEVRYLFDESQKINSDLLLKAKWDSTVLTGYVVKYVRAEYDENDNLIEDISTYSNIVELTTEKRVNDILYDTLVAESAISIISTGTTNFYLADAGYKTLRLSNVDPNDNIIYFFYTEMDSVNYKVYYLKYNGTTYAVGDIPNEEEYLAEPKEVTVTTYDGNAITEIAKNISGYTPRESWIQELQLTANESINVLYFYYEANEEESTYKVNYYIMGDNNQYSTNPTYTEEKTGVVGSVLTLNAVIANSGIDESYLLNRTVDKGNSDIYAIIVNS